MGQVTVQVRFTNARDAVLAHLGHLPVAHVHALDTVAVIDTGAVRSVLPPWVAEHLGLVRLYRTVALYADGRSDEVECTEPFFVDIDGRRMTTSAMVLGQQVLLGVTVLEELDLLVDCTGHRLIPNPAHPQQPAFRV
jgi:predicted aspartyl protease